MKSKRLQTLLSFLSVHDKVIDIGTDHAYIPISLASMGCQKILATDIHEGALKIAQKNILKHHYENVIKTLLTDGLTDVPTMEYDTLVLAGMGYFTIKKILENQNLDSIKKIIVQSNNHIDHLRRFMNSLHYQIVEEKCVLEANHYYVILLYEKGVEYLKEEEFLFGKYSKENQFYYEYLKQSYEKILKQVPEQKKYQEYIQLLEEYISR